MKILILGDIHGRTIWKDIIFRENPDKIIFLGDYVSTHDDINSEQQIYNLEEILQYREENPTKVILLRGNHDMQHLGYYWAECTGLDRDVLEVMSESEFKNRFLNLTRWIYIDKDLKTIFSHAGVSKVWLEHIKKYVISKQDSKYDGTIDLEELLDIINTIEPCELFEFTPNWCGDYSGDSTTQPPTWIRPSSLIYCYVKDWNQVIGHTPVTENIVDLGRALSLPVHIWDCDALEINQYLVIDNNEFIPKQI